MHRDAERQSLDARVKEIKRACRDLVIPAVPVVPVRMTEAWLLFDEPAIRRTAGNPRSVPLVLPDITSLERVADPKATLHEMLRTASELPRRRRSSFDVRESVARLPRFVTDFSPLRALPAFQALEAELSAVIQQQGWNS